MPGCFICNLMKVKLLFFNLLEFVTCHLSLNVHYINLNGPAKLISILHA